MTDDTKHGYTAVTDDTDTDYTVEVRLDHGTTLSELNDLVASIHLPGDDIPGNVKHQGRLVGRSEDDWFAGQWIVVEMKVDDDSVNPSQR